MTDNKQFRQVQDASSDMVASLRETSQVFADRVVTMQNSNLRFAQNTFLSWMDLLTHQTESIQQVQQQWGPQIQKQQGAFQKLMPPSMQISMDFFLAPFILSRKLVEASMTAAECERELVGASMAAVQREREPVL
jgi:hypothetical protein